SPIAPSRSSFDVVPSSWTCTSLPSAQRSKSAAKRALVTRCTSSAEVSRILSWIQSTIGRPPTGRSCFGTVSVSGRSRVAYPAAKINACRSGPLVPRGQVRGLLLGELVDRHAHRLELEARDLAVDLLRNRIHLALELRRVL